MENLHKEIREYLKRLIHNFLYIQSLQNQLKMINDWNKPEKVQAINIGSHFFSLVIYCFHRSILIELSKYLLKNEKRSIRNFLKIACENASIIGPTKYNKVKNGALRVPIKTEVYRKIIRRHKNLIESKEDIIRRLKSIRDQYLAHSDPKFFDNPNAAFQQYSIKNSEIDELLEIIKNILRCHHILLLEGDVNLDTYGMNVDSVLRYILAFSKIRKDKELLKKGFRPVDYMVD